jgi:hypothetical protein
VSPTFSPTASPTKSSRPSKFPTPRPSRAPTIAPPTYEPTFVPTEGPFYLNEHQSLTHYYRFDYDDIQGVSVLNYATKQYDAELMNGATLLSQVGVVKQGDGALNLVSTGNKETSPYFRITDGIMLGNTGLSFAIWFNSRQSGSWARVMEFGNGAPSNTIDVTVMSDQYLGYEVQHGNGNGGEHIRTNLIVNDNTWRHLVYMLNLDYFYTSQLMTFYFTIGMDNSS